MGGIEVQQNLTVSNQMFYQTDKMRIFLERMGEIIVGIKPNTMASVKDWVSS